MTGAGSLFHNQLAMYADPTAAGREMIRLRTATAGFLPRQAAVDIIPEEAKASWVLVKAVERCVTRCSGAHAPPSGLDRGVGTMMPGETPPPSAGTEAAGRACANCGVLQQNMNEYVAALIALKQKIIDGDRLLTEYQQKCTDIL
ncbi:hypothetical protein DV515_00005901 [Chloebia gouldiae]|uniref:Uncharacterized protein n=1 Tax=Chloebia gouldiae TaxID=44316 RepID=A0A3L8SM02_CHLGU|nr:hypothetical protein DV515_00005901 [Chloebia gouldiae]